MRYRITIRSNADADLARTAEWYEGERVDLGVKFLDDFVRTCQSIQAFPSRRPFADRKLGIRICRFKRFPYLIYFTVRESDIVIHAVLHARRSPEVWESRFEG